MPYQCMLPSLMDDFWPALARACKAVLELETRMLRVSLHLAGGKLAYTPVLKWIWNRQPTTPPRQGGTVRDGISGASACIGLPRGGQVRCQ